MAFSNIGSAHTGATGSGLVDLGSSNPASLSVSVPDLGAHSAGVVAFCLHSAGAATLVVSGATWGGSAMTPVINQEPSGDVANSQVHLFFIANPPDNGSKSIVINFSSPATPVSGVYDIVAIWADASSDVIVDDSSQEQGSATQNPDLVITPSTANQLLISASVSEANAVGSPEVSGCTLLQKADSGGNCSITAYNNPTSSGDQTHTHQYSQAEDYAMVGLSLKESVTNETPTIALNTADGLILPSLPPLEFTGSDTEDDDLRYNVQITDNPDGFAGGSILEDTYDYTPGTTGIVHPNPSAAGTTWTGEIQVDDRPGQSFTGAGGVLDKIQFRFGAHETYPEEMSGVAVVRVYAHQGSFGTTSEPLNPAEPADTPTPGWLAISDEMSLVYGVGGETGVIAWREFTFSGANRIRLVDGVHYVAILDWQPTNRTYENTLAVVVRTTDNSHAGNVYIDGEATANNGIWSSLYHTDMDMAFKIYELFTLLDKVSGMDAGFVNTVTGGDTDPFNSGEKVRFTVQAANELDNKITYYWRVRVADPSGSTNYSDWSATRDFSTLAFSRTKLSVLGLPIVPRTFVAKIAASGSVSVTPSAAYVIAANVAPTVIYGSVVLADKYASSVSASTNPTTLLGSIVISDKIASVVSNKVDPVVIYGSLTIVDKIAAAIGGIFEPVALLSNITISDRIALAVASILDPTTILGSVTISDKVADAIADIVNPSVAGGGVSVTPNSADCISTTAAPVVVYGSITIADKIAAAISNVYDPTVIYGNITIVDKVAVAIAGIANPTVLGTGIVITPSATSVVVTTVDPAIIYGSIVVSDKIAAAIATINDPTLILSSITIVPSASSVIVVTIDPTVLSGGLIYSPTAAFVIATTVDPTVIYGNVIVSDKIAYVVAGINDPTLFYGSLVIVDLLAYAISSTIDPTLITPIVRKMLRPFVSSTKQISFTSSVKQTTFVSPIKPTDFISKEQE